MKISIVIFLSIILLFSSVYAKYATEYIDVYGIDIIEYGLYTGHTMNKTTNESLPTGGRNILSKISLIKETDSIPAKIGNMFGFRYKIKGGLIGSEAKITKVLIYPPPGLVNPVTHKTFFKSSFSLKKKLGKTSYTGYTFEKEWELVPGEWTIQLLYGNRKLTEKKFNITKE